ncbi:MAG: hypothetical protein F6K00_33510 [Leptolyngbya sp. SIOISBB]|nr:hypothetical protein [Leptolyngbya sp. SIOISBB]
MLCRDALPLYEERSPPIVIDQGLIDMGISVQSPFNLLIEQMLPAASIAPCDVIEASEEHGGRNKDMSMSSPFVRGELEVEPSQWSGQPSGVAQDIDPVGRPMSIE